MELMCNRYSKSYILLISRYLICLFINAVAMLSRMFLCIFVFYHGKHMLYIFRSACKQAFSILPTLVHCNNNIFTGLSQHGHEWRNPHALFTLAERNLDEVAFSSHSPSALHFQRETSDDLHARLRKLAGNDTIASQSASQSMPGTAPSHRVFLSHQP